MVTVTKHFVDPTAYKIMGKICASGTEILKNKVLRLKDPFTVEETPTSPTSFGITFGGISAMDKDSTDGSTQISVIDEGYFKIYVSGSVVAGQPIYPCGTGYFMGATAGNINALTVSGFICGVSQEDATTGQTALAYLRANR